MNGLDSELEQLRQRLGELQAEQQGIQFRIQQLLLERQRMASPPSPAEADIVLQLWRYRPDVLGDGAIDPPFACSFIDRRKRRARPDGN